MVVKIRLSRFGNRHQPFYNIVVAQARSARDSKPLEVIGTYCPIPKIPTGLSDEEAKVAKPFKDIILDRSRTKYWLGVGAQPSKPVWRLLSLDGKYAVDMANLSALEFGMTLFNYGLKSKF
ncbi:ribosomal protein S16 [Paracoccidioides brasiliensis Pb18]|uniref:Ribosomal protein S16 n=1 Tax=Paracoccidioides brasiliensis (strain Pb18) TaxID=502780 RepID=C1GJ53_PARBD|nr:ribosomal protein S16 [Paracoccidioides brasiliensis Pb18]EEH42469.2 ribosomal protein S16 [Paracoccidioides brasiliensis Pb18]ODH52080.1 ribosomal protein S16 [Paracoccidioides brasiliensis]